ncbi:MAG: hypothetical protein IT445_04670 [Phycisphaeraceae bacterium]|nr:hypothetical protein [Phycisphaeraceae bacterium]
MGRVIAPTIGFTAFVIFLAIGQTWLAVVTCVIAVLELCTGTLMNFYAKAYNKFWANNVRENYSDRMSEEDIERVIKDRPKQVNVDAVPNWLAGVDILLSFVELLLLITAIVLWLR